MNCITVGKSMSGVIANDWKPSMIHKITFQLHYKREYAASLQFKTHTQGIVVVKSIDMRNDPHVLKPFEFAQVGQTFG